MSLFVCICWSVGLFSAKEKKVLWFLSSPLVISHLWTDITEAIQIYQLGLIV